jgi:hypothetical protein
MASNNTGVPNAEHQTSQSTNSNQSSQQQTTTTQGCILHSITSALKRAEDPKIRDIGGFPKGPGGNPFGGG